LVFLLTSISSGTAHAETEKSLISYAVKINCEKAQGAGFRLNSEVIVTAKHVVEDCLNVLVTDNDGLSGRSSTLRFSQKYDIAYVYMTKSVGKEVVVSEKAPVVGESLYTIGSPIDGLVLSKGKLVAAYEDFRGDWLEISIAADQGNSGGPVFSDAGLVGMVISKNITDKRINAYSADLLEKDYETLGEQNGGNDGSDTTVIANGSLSPLLTQSISAIIAFIFGGVAGVVLNQRRQRRLNKKRIRIVIEN
jgi:hypothetical protein